MRVRSPPAAILERSSPRHGLMSTCGIPLPEVLQNFEPADHCTRVAPVGIGLIDQGIRLEVRKAGA
jgi:hypothetical protein